MEFITTLPNALNFTKITVHMTIDEQWIQKVIDMAEINQLNGFAPFAAILVKDNEEVYSSEDKCIQYSDPTAHAELILISEYCRRNKLIHLEGYSIYCNVEPCVMCSGAIHWAKISRVVFSVYQNSLQKISGGKHKPSCVELINAGGGKADILGGVLEPKGLALLKSRPFESKISRFNRHYNR